MTRKLKLPTFDLLTMGNPKIIKGMKQGYAPAVLHLAPADLAGTTAKGKPINVCPHATEGCRNACLNKSGRAGIIKYGEDDNKIQKARRRRTQQFFNDRKRFFKELIYDLHVLSAWGIKNDMIPCVRLNGTSDIAWEKIKHEGKTIFEWFPGMQFYDYTKWPNRKVANIPNYHLTFSLAENNEGKAAVALNNGVNVAVVFRDEMPASYLGKPVVSGDAHDLRFLDDTGVIVGLKAKGPARYDTSGFVKEGINGAEWLAKALIRKAKYDAKVAKAGTEAA